MKLIPDSEDFYDLLKPFGVRRNMAESKKHSIAAFTKLGMLIEGNDAVYKRLSELHFKVDEEHRCLIAVVPRGKVTPDNHEDIVLIDAQTWIQEELNSIQPDFIRYDLVGEIEVVPEFDPIKDIVIYRMQSVYEADIEKCEELLPMSNFITKLYFTAFGFAMLFIASVIACTISYLK